MLSAIQSTIGNILNPSVEQAGTGTEKKVELACHPQAKYDPNRKMLAAEFQGVLGRALVDLTLGL